MMVKLQHAGIAHMTVVGPSRFDPNTLVALLNGGRLLALQRAIAAHQSGVGFKAPHPIEEDIAQKPHPESVAHGHEPKRVCVQVEEGGGEEDKAHIADEAPSPH
jgi:hypothetical protein